MSFSEVPNPFSGVPPTTPGTPTQVLEPGQVELGEGIYGNPQFQNVRIIPEAPSITSSPQERLQNLPDTFTELDLMPVRCMGCGKIMKQLLIEQGIEGGKSIRDVMDELNYVKMCCRNIIIGSPPIVRLQKRVEAEQQLDLSTLTLESTEARATVSEGGITILDDAPPGSIEEPGAGGICFTGGDDLTFDVPGGLDSYSFHMANFE